MTTGIGLSADKITNFYLYGTDSRPANLLDPQILADREGATASVDVNAYMTEGPGRFASPAFFPVVEKVFVATVAAHLPLPRAATRKWERAGVRAYCDL